MIGSSAKTLREEAAFGRVEEGALVISSPCPLTTPPGPGPMAPPPPLATSPSKGSNNVIVFGSSV